MNLQGSIPKIRTKDRSQVPHFQALFLPHYAKSISVGFLLLLATLPAAVLCFLLLTVLSLSSWKVWSLPGRCGNAGSDWPFSDLKADVCLCLGPFPLDLVLSRGSNSEKLLPEANNIEVEMLISNVSWQWSLSSCPGRHGWIFCVTWRPPESVTAYLPCAEILAKVGDQ